MKLLDDLLDIIFLIESSDSHFMNIDTECDEYKTVFHELNKFDESDKKKYNNLFQEERRYFIVDNKKIIWRFMNGQGYGYQIILYKPEEEDHFTLTKEEASSFGISKEEINDLRLDDQVPMVWEDNLAIILNKENF